MNDLQLFYYYQTIPLDTITKRSWIYPKYVVITGRSFCRPHPHRHYNLDEFLDKLYSDPEFKKKLL